ncbi:NAD(P)-dependent alcohol dehydrogenase [Adhaeribacter sp. BT258]|uniref:NAD(P)-dependent alcohol dehydrogenase n=1 Tax=Adhaeribacter terrigena TaxID=2793070 RepID=A0ABS1C207_9BACT|nr:NAD(P)-dependent alcohol dehydrogenase [Adhaeribacter terrigena]MBK0403222.1 NAD(P)-dependent alcohol dehydrogenase [Adhaeribacter terrigena]
MIPAKGYAAPSATEDLKPFRFERREVGEHDVLIDILYCGVCHSDIHQARNEWGGSIYPMVPGHEIVGRISKVGSAVSKFKVGDLAGVGCFVDSCRTCESCQENLEQYCEVHNVGTYNSLEMDNKTVTYGGYSSQIVVDENYTLKVSEKLDLKRVAPLLCAGITTYSPIMHWKMGKGHKVAIVGLGGLGHMAVKLAASMGADVTVLSTSPNKEKDAFDLGAHNFAVTKDPEQVKKLKNTFHFIIDTVSAPHDYNLYLSMLKRDGTMVLLGAPPEPTPVAAFNLIAKRKRLVGSMIGGIKETQEMLDYCAEHNIMSDVEMIPIQKINEAYERTLKSDVRYRFVIDMASLEKE